MDFSQHSDGVYLTPQPRVDEATTRKVLESRKVEQQSLRGDRVYYINDSTVCTSDFNKCPVMEEVYVLPAQDRTIIESQKQIPPIHQKKKKRVVEDLYDENHYALPDINNCVTQHAGVLREVSNDKDLNPSVKKTILTRKNMKRMGIIFLSIWLAGISSILLMIMLSGTI